MHPPPSERYRNVCRRRRKWLLVLAFAAAPRAAAQAPAADDYVRVGLREAFSQRHQALDLAQAELRYREIRALSLPSLTLHSLNTRAAGNVIDVGRFVNPAYAALNQLVNAASFPTDISLQLPLPSQQFIRVSQPLLAPSAWRGATAAARAADAQRVARDGATRRLAAEIRLAWLTWLKATRVLKAYDAAVALLEEQVRIAERLEAEGVAGQEVALRARAERSAVAQERLLAAQRGAGAGRRLNHLVARPLETPIVGADTLGFAPLPSLDATLSSALRARSELRHLEALGRAAEAQRRAAQSAFLPSVAVVFDYGVQGPDTRFGGDRDYTMLTVMAQWNVFNGDADRARSQQADLQRRGVAVRQDEATSLVELEVRTAHAAASAAVGAVGAADEQRVAMDRAYTIVIRRFGEGTATLVEVLDARRSLTAAVIAQAVAIADFHARRVELLRAAALDEDVTP